MPKMSVTNGQINAFGAACTATAAAGGLLLFSPYHVAGCVICLVAIAAMLAFGWMTGL